MLSLGTQLDLERCPLCSVDKPSLTSVHGNIHQTFDYKKEIERHWRFYTCSRCGGIVTAYAYKDSSPNVEDYFPKGKQVDEELPSRAKEYLLQAIGSLSAPSGSIMLCASSVDAMLKDIGYKEGKLYSRIKKAAKEGAITKDMEKWAHEVRLDANDQRHADENSDLPTTADAGKAIDFVNALGQYLFVLPARINQGIESAKES